MCPDENGFTMIELIMVIVILGLLAAVAVPKFVDVKDDAKKGTANRVYVAAQGAAAINLAKGIVGKPGHVPVTNGASLLAAIDDPPDNWYAGTTNSAQICFDENGDNDCTAADTYIITVLSAENIGTPQTKASLGKSW